MMGLFFPATAAENCACYLTFYSQWMQATFHACTGSFKRCQSCPTISGVSVTNQELRWLLFSATRGGKLRLRPHILFSMDAGDLPRLYRILPSLSKLAHYPRCICYYPRIEEATFLRHPRRKIALDTSHFALNGCRRPSTPAPALGLAIAVKAFQLSQVYLLLPKN